MRISVRLCIGTATIAMICSVLLVGVNVTTSAAATSAPIGALDVAALVPDSQPRVNQGALPSLRVAGWAIDPDTTAAVKVHVYLNGTLIAAIDAAQNRTDVASVYPMSGAAHGYDVTLLAEQPGFPFWRLAPGANTVCTYGIDTGTDDNALLGCQTVMAGRSPFGSLDVVTALPEGLLRVAGWVIDPDTVSATGVHIWVDGAFTASAHAGSTRSDVGAAFPAYGDLHGFDTVISNLRNGNHTVCVYGMDTGLGSTQFAPNALLRCAPVTIAGNPIEARDVSPIGALDVVTVQSEHIARVAGWAIDPDTAAAINVHIHIDGNLRALAHPAQGSRSDVGAAYPLYGALHGYDLTMGWEPGTHTVCAYGFDSDTAAPALLGCKTIAA